MARRSELYRRWSHETRRSAFFRAGERVGVAVSGGPDSQLLLDFMREFAHEEGLTLAVAHFNHHLRGRDSDEDERFVAERAKEWGLEFLRGEGETAREAETKGRNLEATAREQRYRFFFSLLNQNRQDKIATAHTANDQAETVLLKMLRGAGTRGLAGIFPVLEGKIFRPFLNLTRREVEAEIAERKLEFRQDATNLLPRFRRNKIRLELIPWLEKEFNPDIVRLLVELAKRAQDDEEALEQAARERSRPWRLREGREEKIPRSEEHTSELQSPYDLVCRLLLEKKNIVNFRRLSALDGVRLQRIIAQRDRRLVDFGVTDLLRIARWGAHSPASVALPLSLFHDAV